MAVEPVKCLEINRSVWTVPQQFDELSAIGTGTFGSVCSALHTPTGKRVAIKKLNQCFLTPTISQRTFREVMLLQHLRHENIIDLQDAFVAARPDTGEAEVYLVTSLMGADLHAVLQMQFISDQHVQFILYQILRALVYLHSAGVIHRDLKPSNIAMTATCDVRILDFGLARPTAEGLMTGYVQTRWYRAPEVIVGCPYDEKADMWSVGCILAEMLTNTPLFPGDSPIEQVHKYVRCLGPLPPAVLDAMSSPATRQFFLEYREVQDPRFSLDAVLAGKNPQAIELVKLLLQYSPEARFSAEQAIAHPFVSSFHDAADEPRAPARFDDSFEKSKHTAEEWRALVQQHIRVVGGAG